MHFIIAYLAVVDGQWSPWSKWSTCDADCKQYRARNCSQPAPSLGGKPCLGEGVQVLSCLSGQCKGIITQDIMDQLESRDSFKIQHKKSLCYN